MVVKHLDNEILEILKAMQSELKEVSSKMERVETKLGSVETKTDKNTIMLEEVNKKISIIAEVQTSFAELLERAKDKDGKPLTDRLNIIELAVTDTSGRVKDIHKELSRAVRTTAENWVEPIELKAVK